MKERALRRPFFFALESWRAAELESWRAAELQSWSGATAGVCVCAGLGGHGWGVGTRCKYVHVSSYAAIHGGIRSRHPTHARPLTVGWCPRGRAGAGCAAPAVMVGALLFGFVGYTALPPLCISALH